MEVYYMLDEINTFLIFTLNFIQYIKKLSPTKVFVYYKSYIKSSL